MAYQNPAFVQNENVHIHGGKGIDGVKADFVLKPTKTGRKERKALADLSNARKPLLSGPLKGSTLKEKSVVHGRETNNNAPKSSFLTDKEIKRCCEWAQEGFEQIHFTGNDIQKLQQDMVEDRVRKKVAKVMSALDEWAKTSCDLGMPMMEDFEDTEDITKMELEPEVLPPVTRSLSISGGVETENFFLTAELDHLPYVAHSFELKLKTHYDSDIPFL